MMAYIDNKVSTIGNTTFSDFLNHAIGVIEYNRMERKQKRKFTRTLKKENVTFFKWVTMDKTAQERMKRCSETFTKRELRDLTTACHTVGKIEKAGYDLTYIHFGRKDLVELYSSAENPMTGVVSDVVTLGPPGEYEYGISIPTDIAVDVFGPNTEPGSRVSVS